MTSNHSLATGTQSTFLPLVLIALTVLLLYLPTSTFPFINFDDDVYVYQNQHVTQGITAEGIKWAFLPDAKNSSYWHPLAWISLMLDVEIFGVNPGAHHTINWLIHLANAILLFYLIKNTTGYLWRSTLIAVIFAVHPVNLESVVWISERKNVLSTFFCLATLLAYANYVKQRTWVGYLAALLFFAQGLLTKPMLVTLPALLLLLDFWPLQRYNPAIKNEPGSPKPGLMKFASQNRRLLLEKIPFILLVVAVIIFSFQAINHQGMRLSFQTVPLTLRLENVVSSFVAYLGKLIYPVNLAVFYPFPATIDYWLVLVAALTLGVITTLVLLNLKNRPWLSTGWFWFLISLAPVAGITQIGLWPRMADRWLYLPEIGILLIFTWGITELADRLDLRKSTRALGAAVVMLLLISSSFKQIQYWRDSIGLLKHSLAVGGPHQIIYNNLGGALLEQKRPLEAITYLNQSLTVDAEQVSVLTNLGVAYAQLNQLDKAVIYFEHALKNDPSQHATRGNLELVTRKKQRLEKMAVATQAALGGNPESPELLNRLGAIFFNLGRIQPAVDCYEKSIRLEPGNKQAFNELGSIYLLHGKTNESLVFFKEAMRLDSNFADARKNLLHAEEILARKE
jgi:tetratricopeptide (TPR) repeat protein